MTPLEWLDVSSGLVQFDFLTLMASGGTKPPTVSIPAENLATSFYAYCEKPYFIDSGASEHFIVDPADFVIYEPLENMTGQAAEAGSRFCILGKGTVYKTVEMNRKATILELTAYHAPDFAANLILVSRLTSKGCTIVLKDSGVQFISSTGSKFMIGSLANGM
jgi:hypothetical protein